jgi:hypothetical protein
MGKRNRRRNRKKSKLIDELTLSSSHHLDSSFSLNSAMPSIDEIQNCKEEFNEALQQAYSGCIYNFQTQIHDRLKGIQPRKHFNLPDLGNIDKLKILGLRLSRVLDHDPSNEVSHIFYAHVNSFINKLLEVIRNLSGQTSEHILAGVSDSYKAVQLASEWVNLFTYSLFEKEDDTTLNTLTTTQLLFYEKIVKDRIVQEVMEKSKKNKVRNGHADNALHIEQELDILSTTITIKPMMQALKLTKEILEMGGRFSDDEEVSQIYRYFRMEDFISILHNQEEKTLSKSSKKRNRQRKKKKESLENFPEMDKEVEEFRLRLEAHENTTKLKPNLSNEWIDALRKEINLKSTFAH